MADVVTEEGFRGPQVCSLVGITYRQLDYWARTNLLRPSISEARGSGTQRRYSYRDLLELKVIKRLLDAEGVLLQNDEEAEDPKSQDELVMEFREFIEGVRPEDFSSGA